ncbi:SH3 domain-containing protein [Rhizobium halophytocola]|uniref:Uncharacterized protein YraI n=1 Tax=Rhizobium halophytocola TaxID=735519 RepID=A0ABS4E274_9HYPH|nr:SH3 domain-containing protein [Rhizobium halophytocola]MBP1852059.1 uncharacterized protein YraI [Rhizobium halophytocola]
MNKLAMLAATAALTAMSPALAQAATAFSTANVNLRAGPSTDYPAVIVIPNGSKVQVYGCMQSPNWCDVGYSGGRGWVSGTYIQMTYSSKRVYVQPDYYKRLGVPVVTFSVGSYWGSHYKSRSFYNQRDKWEHRDGGHRDDNRHDAKPVAQGDNRNDHRNDHNAVAPKPMAPKPDARRDDNRHDDRNTKRPAATHNDRNDHKKPACKPGQKGDCQPG